MRAWQEDKNFRELVLKDKDITKRVPRAQIERAFDLKRQLRNVDKIFARVFPDTQPRRQPTKGSPQRTRRRTKKN
jgi:adenylosuccinate lyase